MNVPVFTKGLLSGALDTIYLREEIATRRVNAIRSKLTERWKSITGKDAAKYMVYYDVVCGTGYNGSYCDWAEHGYGMIDMGRPYVKTGLVARRKSHITFTSMTVKGSIRDS
ncbi:MAG: hypothetical protein QW292_12040 [Candidatus Parvarchaeota archaeon]